MYLDNLYKPIEYQGHGSKVKVTWFFVCDKIFSGQWVQPRISPSLGSLGPPPI